VTKRRRRAGRARAAQEDRISPPAPRAPERFLGRHHDGIVRAALQSGWILAGVLLLGWSASLVIGGIYLETLFGSIGLRRALRVARRQHVKADQGSAGEVTQKAVMAGLAQGVFLLVLSFGVLRDPEGVEAVWRFWPHELTLVFAGALLAAAADYVLVLRSVRTAPDALVRRRVDRQLATVLLLIMLMLIVPWSFFLVGELGMVVTLFVLKGLLDVWMAGTDVRS
jgi:hypothetical protein